MSDEEIEKLKIDHEYLARKLDTSKKWKKESRRLEKERRLQERLKKKNDD